MTREPIGPAPSASLAARIGTGGWSALAPLGVLVVIWAVFQIANPSFLSSANLVNLAMQSAATGPFGAIRTISDIALKALSPAVNDPSRAVQALDQLEVILIRLSPLVAEQERELAGHPEDSVLRDWTRSWEEYVAAAVDEIRQFGTTSVQIQRRLRAFLTALSEVCPPSQQTALSERMAVLDRGTDRWWTDPFDRRLAVVADPEGIGGAELN